jgi:hypothetical protein
MINLIAILSFLLGSLRACIWTLWNLIVVRESKNFVNIYTNETYSHTSGATVGSTVVAIECNPTKNTHKGILMGISWSCS